MRVHSAIALLFFLVLPCRANIYVATNGNDSTGTGAIGAPFASVSNAVVYARTLNNTTNRTITIRGGHYYNVAIVLNPDTNDKNLTFEGYPGETAVLYGGMLITNWSSVSNGWYAAALPSYPGLAVTNVSILTNWQVRMLLVDGVSAVRAQYPTNGGSLYYTNSNGAFVLGYTNGDLGSWLSVTNSEFQIDHSYTASTVGAASIDTNAQQVTFLSNPQFGLPYSSDVKTYRVFNIAQGMSKAGQFYYDRNNQSIIYWPIGGKDPNVSECVVPTTSTVFLIKGRQFARTSNIVLSNLTIAVATYPLAKEGDDGSAIGCGMVQSGYMDNLTLDAVVLGPVAGHAFWSLGGNECTNEYIRNCVIQNCGAGGIQSGATSAVISNNFIHSVGGICPQSPGIWLPSYSTVANNSVFDCAMSAIGGNYVTGSSIINNSISNCMQKLRDLGAIYTWTSTNNIISSNLIQHVGGYTQDGSDLRDWYHFGIYCDDYTEGYTISGNIFNDCTRPLMIHHCSNHVITNNVFVNVSNIVMLDFHTNPDTNHIFQRNICYSTTNLYVFNNQGGGVDAWNCVVDWRTNIFYSITSGGVGCGNTVDAASGICGIPTNSVASNPLFITVPTGPIRYLEDANFGFQAGSPCPALGIQPLSLAGIGYNGGLGHRPPTISVGTLRVGTIRGP